MGSQSLMNIGALIHAPSWHLKLAALIHLMSQTAVGDRGSAFGYKLSENHPNYRSSPPGHKTQPTLGGRLPFEVELLSQGAKSPGVGAPRV